MAIITRTSDRDREQMRRAAASTVGGPSEEEQAGGSWPMEIFRRFVGEPDDLYAVDFKTLRRMRNDHMIAMGLHFIIMPCLKAPWYYESDDARAAAFADNLIRPIYGGLLMTILRMLWSGYSPAAKDFKFIQPNWTYYDQISGETKKVWDNGSIDAAVFKPVIPLRPEYCKPRFKSGDFNGIDYDEAYGPIGGSFLINGTATKKIDLLHSLWAVHDREWQDNNIWGFPRIAHAAPIYHLYWYLWSLLGRAFENNADPGPVVGYPRDDPNQVDTDGKTVKNVETALRMGRRRRSGSTLAMPSEVYTDYQDRPTAARKWYVEYPKIETNFSDMMQMLGFLEAAKLRALWIPEQGVIEGSGGTSSRNVATEFGNQRDESQIVLMQRVDEIIDNILVKPGLAINMPQFEGTIRKRTFGLGSDEQEVQRQFFQLIGMGDWRNFGVDARKLAEVNGLPMLDHEEMKRQLVEAANTASNGGPPAVEPTQGRRAFVTQSGFGEMQYVQMGSEIHLARDGDFVASLPKNDVFSDSVVVAAARLLRSNSDAFLAWAYADLTRFCARQKLELAEDLNGEYLDEEAKAKKIAAAIVKRWSPRAQKMADFVAQAQRALARVYDRTSSLKLKNVGTQKRINSADREAAAWLQDQSVSMVRDVLETTRDQIRDVLAQSVLAGKTKADITSELKLHFDGFSTTRAKAIAQTETSRAYNFATVSAGIAAGLKKAQLIDGEEDEPCRRRNGKIVNLTDALHEDLNHPYCTFMVRLLPKASELDVQRAPLEDGLLARFDEETETVLLSPEISSEDETKYLLAVGDRLS